MVAPSSFELRKFFAPEFLFGIGALEAGIQYALNFGARNLLVVTDSGVLEAGWPQKALAGAEERGLRYVIFPGVSSNPRAEQVMAGADCYRAQGCDAILAVGGGSPIDCAKGIGLVASSGRHIFDFEGVDRVEEPMPPMLCVPTTGGTSADVSQFALINDPLRHLKFGIISKAMVPDVSLIDPRTLTTMSSTLTAATGMDAFTHGIEAFVSNGHSPLTDIHALEGIRLVSRHLLPSIQFPDDLTHRENMMLGSLHAGLAFSNASLGAVHAMAHALGGLLDSPHGECNALLLEHVIAFNYKSAPERYRAVSEAIGVPVAGLSQAKAEQALVDAVRQLRRSAGLVKTLGEMGARRSDIPHLAAAAMKDVCMVTNPRVPSERDIETIYEEAL